MKNITGETEFIIGIDFGSSETCATVYDSKIGDKNDLEILPDLKVIKSAVAIFEEEGMDTICVGDAAIQNAPYSKDFQIGFKKRPSEMNLSERNRMVAFMHGVYREILRRYPDFAARSHVIYMSVPMSDYVFEKEEREYLKMAEDAGLPIAGIIKRYSATIFHTLSQPDSPIDQYYKNGFLLVDYGANTIDFVYINGNLSKPIFGGNPIGASAIERILLRYAMENPSDAYMTEFAKLYGSDEESLPYMLLLDRFRTAKERFYLDEHKRFSVLLDYQMLTATGNIQIDGFGGVVIPKEKIDKILGRNNRDSYIGQIKEYARFFKDNILIDNKVGCVYITGGASRMDFVRPIFMEVFNLDEVHCLLDGNPSVVISQGIVDFVYEFYVARKYSQEFNFLS